MLLNQFIVHTEDQDCGSPLSNKERLMLEYFKIREAAIDAPQPIKKHQKGVWRFVLRSPVLQGFRYVHWNLSFNDSTNTHSHWIHSVVPAPSHW